MESPQPTPLPSLAANIQSLSGRKRHQPELLTAAEMELAKAVSQVERRRERNRMHQARHKLKQQKFTLRPAGSSRRLREEVQELTLKRQLIHYGVPTTSNVWSVAAEFFRLFRRSVRPVEPPNALTPCNNYNAQRDFLKSTMATDVTDGEVYGVEALLETWALQSVCYDDIDLQPVRLEESPRGSVLATTKGTLTINENTLRFAFPHLVDSTEWSNLAVKMLGQRLALRGSVEFEWDAASARVTSIVCKADILTPLLQLFGSLDDVSRVFEQAQLTTEGRLVSSGEGLECAR
ncbi:hypothetical protein PHYSODRAFT_470113 [Phytophthora sojae]|uniref:BZIP domain-containing protein n=1 Tax=Phytophthora sojae (strain P6497) TaxID=1094619 RepID=G4YFV5_PHYSP|nr:hypothetical protein PHYSODRAFT_470113 [Phytophthora sojae]EGZ27681.1 hypothetical protein PHYSODRAFT_470113 [Phytophthora sojae]|eukprot:XP_009514956.1 hypothetical protein PHYSODRAFT_470113 [Phytophthora sojae]